MTGVQTCALPICGFFEMGEIERDALINVNVHGELESVTVREGKAKLVIGSDHVNGVKGDYNLICQNVFEAAARQMPSLKWEIEEALSAYRTHEDPEDYKRAMSPVCL